MARSTTARESLALRLALFPSQARLFDRVRIGRLTETDGILIWCSVCVGLGRKNAQKSDTAYRRTQRNDDGCPRWLQIPLASCIRPDAHSIACSWSLAWKAMNERSNRQWSRMLEHAQRQLQPGLSVRRREPRSWPRRRRAARSLLQPRRAHQRQQRCPRPHHRLMRSRG